MNKKFLLQMMAILFMALFCTGLTSCGSDDEGSNGGNLTGIWIHKSKYASSKYNFDYVMAFKNGKVFEEEVWEYTDKQDFMRKYNSPDYWEDYSFSNGILYVDGFSSKITFGDNSFSYTDGDGKTQTFNRWNGTIESLFE